LKSAFGVLECGGHAAVGWVSILEEYAEGNGRSKTGWKIIWRVIFQVWNSRRRFAMAELCRLPNDRWMDAGGYASLDEFPRDAHLLGQITARDLKWLRAEYERCENAVLRLEMSAAILFTALGAVLVVWIVRRRRNALRLKRVGLIRE
jgi:hypothetical protein